MKEASKKTNNLILHNAHYWAIVDGLYTQKEIKAELLSENLFNTNFEHDNTYVYLPVDETNFQIITV